MELLFWRATEGNSEEAFLVASSHFKEFAAGKDGLPCLYSRAFGLTGPSRPYTLWHVF